MIYELAYGKKIIEFKLNEKNVLGVLKANNYIGKQNEEEIVEHSLNNPINSFDIDTIINNKKLKTVTIVVNDITRPTPYKIILPPLLKKLHNSGIQQANIKLIIATGIHRPHTYEDNLAIFGEDICNNYKIINHDPDNNLKNLGLLSNGMKLIINKDVAESDLLITTGVVTLHYFAGFSGGRKSILPGVAGRELIKENHKMMSNEKACLGNYEDNPVNEIMLEAAKKVGVDFIINVVTGKNNKIIHCSSGDLYHAWLDSVKFCENINVVPIEKKADIVIASCGGYPKDINMYQAQKALDSAVLAAKDGGTLILVAECSEGLGEETFKEWLELAKSTDDIKKRFDMNFQLGGHKAYAISRILDKVSVILISQLSIDTVKKLFFTHASNMDEALQIVSERYGQNIEFYIMPDATKIAVKQQKA